MIPFKKPKELSAQITPDLIKVGFYAFIFLALNQDFKMVYGNAHDVLAYLAPRIFSQSW